MVNKIQTKNISELGIEVEIEIHNKDKCLKDITIPKGWRLLRAEEIIFLFNNYRKELNLNDTWEFIEQPFNLNKDRGYVARFDADSGRAVLGCGRHPDGSSSSLGVRFCRDIKEKKDYKKLYFELKTKLDKLKELFK